MEIKQHLQRLLLQISEDFKKSDYEYVKKCSIEQRYDIWKKVDVLLVKEMKSMINDRIEKPLQLLCECISDMYLEERCNNWWCGLLLCRLIDLSYLVSRFGSMKEEYKKGELTGSTIRNMYNERLGLFDKCKEFEYVKGVLKKAKILS